MRTAICVIGLFCAIIVNAQTDSSSSGTLPGNEDIPVTVAMASVDNNNKTALEWNGYLQTDDRLKFDGWQLNWQEYRFSLKTDYRFREKARLRSELWLRGLRFPGITSLSDLMFPNKVMPLDVNLREAYVDLYGLFTKNLDVRIGRQRIAWGTGDRFNPTDNLNPYDLEDIWEFGRHLSSDAVKLDYYAGNWTFTGVGILHFRPSVLPNEEWTPAFMPAFSYPEIIYDSSTIPGFTIPVYLTGVNARDTIELPARDMKHSPSFGLKIKRSLGAWDLSLSYVYARDALPALRHIHTDLTLDTMIVNLPLELYAQAHTDVKAYLYYPVQKIIGFDFAGSLWGAGLRGEAALIFPEEINIRQTLHYEAPLFGIARDSVLPDSVLLDGNPYIKFVVGADYTFRNNIYLNFQYLHGFLHERGAKELNDYFMLGLEYPMLKNKLKLSLLNCALQVGDWKNIKNNYAVIYMPEVSYTPVDNFNIIAGARFIEGKSTTAFGKVSSNDEMYVKMRYSF